MCLILISGSKQHWNQHQCRFGLFGSQSSSLCQFHVEECATWALLGSTSPEIDNVLVPAWPLKSTQLALNNGVCWWHKSTLQNEICDFLVGSKTEIIWFPTRNSIYTCFFFTASKVLKIFIIVVNANLTNATKWMWILKINTGAKIWQCNSDLF